MKFSKKIMITMFICFFISGAIYSIVSSALLKLDISNAVQTIGSIVLYTGGEDGSILHGILTEGDGKLKITGSGDNFVINNANKIIHGKNSSILGGSGNNINGGSDSTILAGENNNIQSDNSFIGGGNNNEIFNNSTGSVILGGVRNKINTLNLNGENSVIVGNDNEINASYSSVVGNNSTVGSDNTRTINSVAMGSGAKVVGDNTFLWTDGSYDGVVLADNVFVIMSSHGMSINESNPNINALFNVGGYFVISEGIYDGDIQCGTGNGTGIIKVVDRDDITDQKCLCSCNGEAWNSLFGKGQCESVCNGGGSDVFPECVEGGIKIVLSGSDKVFSGECIGGSVIEGSYHMDGDTIWWQCQGENGNTTGCSYKSECTGNIPGLEDGSMQINNNIIPSLLSDQREYKYSIDKNEICSYSCKEGYALSGSECLKVCNESNKTCKLGEYKNLNQTTYTQKYEYGCEYDEMLYKCEANCDNGKIWNGGECVEVDDFCGTSRYECLLGKASNTGMNLENFTWDCIDENDEVIGESPSCSIPKDIVNRKVYYNYARSLDHKQNIYFYMTGGDIPVDIKINQEYEDGSSSVVYTIPAYQKSSKKMSFNQTIVFKYPSWYSSTDYTIKDDRLLYIPVGEKLYILEIEKDDTLCSNTCSTAGQCLNGATTSEFKYITGINYSDVKFTWKCSKGSDKIEQCNVRCDLDFGKCEGNIQNSQSCNPSSDIDCNIKGSLILGSSISFTDFYMKTDEDKIVRSNCGNKRHCIFSGGYISCVDSVENCTEEGFKCNNGYVLNGCVCESISEICKTNRNPGGCGGGMVATGYSKEVGKNVYSYYCTTGDQKVKCEASCSAGQIWNGTKCITMPNLCGDKHNDCINQSSLKSNQRDEFEKKYKRTCKLGNNTQNCSECYSGYIMSGTECVVKPAVNCEATEYNGYKVPYLLNGNGKQVEKNTRNSVCKLQVRCETGTIKSYSAENCRNVCNTGTNLGSCIEGISVKKYIGNMGESGYTYLCENNSGYVFDRCYGKCPSGEYWNGSTCGAFDRELCSSSHYECINGGISVGGSVNRNSNSGYTTYVYQWNCKMGDYTTGCDETITQANGCKKGTYSGYYVKSNLGHEEQVSVEKIENSANCKAIAVCESGRISIKDENCSNACPGGIMDTPKCNYDGLYPSSYQSATWTSGYTYKCGNFLCSANCSGGKVWNGTKCISHYAPYCSGTALKCNFGIVQQIANGVWGFTWNCININYESLNPSICYKCNDGYVWNSSSNICEEKSCGAVSRSGYNIPSLSGGSNTRLQRNITNGTCSVSVQCSKGNLTLGSEECTCSGGYYLDGKVCKSICGDGTTNPCNSPYTATGALWEYSPGNRGNKYGTQYTCSRTYNGTLNTQQCNCPGGSIWNGSVCGDIPSSLCKEGAGNYFKCNNSYAVDQLDDISGYTWKCKNAKNTESCHLCKSGYKWDDITEKCIAETKVCGGMKPSGDGVVLGPSTYIGELDLERTYNNGGNVSTRPCNWSCLGGYISSPELKTCKKEPTIINPGTSCNYSWMCTNTNKVICSSSCSPESCGEVSDSKCKDAGSKPTDCTNIRQCLYENENYGCHEGCELLGFVCVNTNKSIMVDNFANNGLCPKGTIESNGVCCPTDYPIYNPLSGACFAKCNE